MARKRYSDEDVLKLLREIDVHLHDGLDVVSACRCLAPYTRPLIFGFSNKVSGTGGRMFNA